ncbi:glycoside hydrolase family 88/105 protein [Spirochaeta cellobiosiphila]|uniref:glycoside hydrolase family 88/105 protein n=1 Tax=Spirochaeta cellobiosiphila TaxID=504483 RepID=UPI0005609DB6|nr:glycoside hydrolase family 88 protein [Spirochaeta cellobiosiphila]
MPDKNEIYAMVDSYIDKILATGSPEKPVWNQEMLRQNKKPHWNYIDGCMMTAFLTLYESSKDKKYLDFVDNFIDYFVKEDGSILSFELETYNLDNIKEGSVLYKLYDYTGKQKYRKAMDTLYRQIKEQPRTIEGNFWHKLIYPGQVWLDGLYMAQPFYVEYEKRFKNKEGFADSFKQFMNVTQMMKDEKTGLYYHAYDSPRMMYWSDDATGNSPHFWLRALGWFLMALVDIIELLDAEDKEFRDFMQKTLEDLIESLIRFQDESGMWYQVVDKGNKKGNYLETSGSSIIAYAILKACRLNVLSDKYLEAGKKAFFGICDTYLKPDDTGSFNLGGTCLVAGLGGKQQRNGSYEYYISEPVVENEAKGIAPFLLAYVYLRGLED